MKNTKGFTLVELLLFAVLIGMIVAAASLFFTVSSRQRIRSQVIAEVESQGIAAMQVITQTIRNATAINSPAAGGSAASLSVNVPTGSASPTVFDLSGGVLRVTEGAGFPVDLTSSRVSVSALSFTNLNGSVRISFVVSYASGVGQEYSYTKTFFSSATLR